MAVPLVVDGHRGAQPEIQYGGASLNFETSAQTSAHVHPPHRAAYRLAPPTDPCILIVHTLYSGCTRSALHAEPRCGEAPYPNRMT